MLMFTLPIRDRAAPTGRENPPPDGGGGGGGGGGGVTVPVALVSAAVESTNDVRVGPGLGGGGCGCACCGCGWRRAASRVNGSSQRTPALVALAKVPSWSVGDRSGVRASV